MAAMRCVVFFAALAGAAAVDVTPIEKVIELLEGMKKEVVADGKSEASSYEEFACFCKSTTERKSTSVERGTKEIGRLSASIGDKTEQKAEKSAELSKRKQAQEESNRKLTETEVRCSKQKAEYNAQAADLSKAITGLKDALKAMEDSKPSPAAFLAIRQTLELADAMSLLKTSKHQAVAAFLQQSSGVDPKDPEYNFHSNDIISVCEDLLKEYKATKKSVDEEWAKTDSGCKQMKASLRKKLASNKFAMEALEKDIQKLASRIARHREMLVTAEGVLKDDELYLKDLTARCEARANDYDQRSAMRNDEVTALTQALEVLTKSVKDRTEVNVRALLMQKGQQKVVVDAPESSLKSISLLQEASSNTVGTFLGVSVESRKNKAITLLQSEGKRIHSVALTSLAERVSADPFEKVKGLIQKLIERLLAESQAEATKKGFCDTELAKARHDRDARYTESRELNAELVALEATRDELTEEIKTLTKELKEENLALKETTKERQDDKKANLKTIKTAQEGFEAVNEALLILRSFYKQAAKAAFVQASPVDEDTAGAGFSGNYGGKQSGAKAVFALLETIASDFDRTLRTTKEAEDAAHREYVEFSQASQSSIAGKETKKELDTQDLETTKTTIEQKMNDLQTAVDLHDKALMELEELKPVCIDTGMSYAERVEKREEEIKALNNALEILRP
jgi:hypothetical protein